MELILNLLESLAGFKGHQNWAIGPQKFSWQSRLGPSYDRRPVFHLAKFDEIDYCNQNLGAVLAGLAMIYIAGDDKPSDVTLRFVIAIGAISLLSGGYFAVT